MSTKGPSPTDRALRGKAGEASAAQEAEGFPESGAGLGVGGRRGHSGRDGRASERGPHSQGHAEASDGFKQKRWVYFDAPLAGNWMGWGQGARSGGYHPWDQSGHGACEHPRLPTEMALNDAALGHASYCVWICQGSWKAHLGRANVDGREGDEPPRKVEGLRHLGAGTRVEGHLGTGLGARVEGLSGVRCRWLVVVSERQPFTHG